MRQIRPPQLTRAALRSRRRRQPQWVGRPAPQFHWNNHLFWFEQDLLLNLMILGRWLWRWEGVKYICLGLYYGGLVLLFWQL